jgi:hypothetical protein
MVDIPAKLKNQTAIAASYQICVIFIIPNSNSYYQKKLDNFLNPHYICSIIYNSIGKEKL